TYTATTVAAPGTIGEFATGITAGSLPNGIAPGPDGNPWFTEAPANKIRKITPTGTLSEIATGITAARSPPATDAGPDGNLWFTEFSGSRIGKLVANVLAITNVASSAGPGAGGSTVTLTGTGFVPSTLVAFGGIAATAVVVSSSTQLTARTLAHAAGT